MSEIRKETLKNKYTYLIYLSYIRFKTCDHCTEMDMSEKFPP